MADLFNAQTQILLSSPRSFLITPEGSQCPVKLTEQQREKIANDWQRVQNVQVIGRVRGTLYTCPASTYTD